MIKPKKTLHIHSHEEEGALGFCLSPLFTERYLPVPLTSFIGREQEIGTVRSLLQESSTRLLTLTGPGGVGKTRLALQVAREVSATFADEIYFVSLASVNTVDQVLPAIAKALGFNKSGQYRWRHIQAMLPEQRCLLLLDNFEHVAGAAPQLHQLLMASPHLKILVTSRTVLRLRGEQEFSVAPLALPDLSFLPSCEELTRVASVALFLQRARTVQPEFELTSENALAIAQICTRLDGLPLALELAAQRIKLFSPQGLLERLEKRFSFLNGGPCDVPERHQSLRKAIDWSYRALTQKEQQLFRGLSVFSGSCSLHAIEAVCGATGRDDESFLDTLTSLLNHSLLHRDGSADHREYRFAMLETIKEYASECLQNSDERETIAQAHAEYYLALTQIMELQAEQGEALQRLTSEFENLRTAFSWFLSSQEREQALRMRIIGMRSPHSLAVCLLVMGTILALQKRYVWAIRLWGKAKALSTPKDKPTMTTSYEWLAALLGADRLYAQTVEAIRLQLGDQAFTVAWHEGETLTPEQLLVKSGSSMIDASSSSSAKKTVPYFQRLTPREREVLRLLTQGLSSAIIAEELFVSLTTVNSHIRTIYNKLEVSSRSAATRCALEHHLV